MNTNDIQPMHQAAELGDEVPAAIINPGDMVRGLGVVDKIRWNASGLWLYSNYRGQFYMENETVIHESSKL